MILAKTIIITQTKNLLKFLRRRENTKEIKHKEQEKELKELASMNELTVQLSTELSIIILLKEALEVLMPQTIRNVRL